VKPRRGSLRLGDIHCEAIVNSVGPAGRVLVLSAVHVIPELEARLPAHATIRYASGAHIDAVRDHDFDLILVDGRMPGGLSRARGLLNEKGRVFLHEAQRSWHDRAKCQFVEHGTIGPCAEAPLSHLWYGGLSPQPSSSAGGSPVIVSYFTANSRSEELALQLRDSCEALGLPHHITALAPSKSREINCAAKARVCLEAWRTLGTSLLWVDADAVMRRRPDMIAGSPCDFAIHKWKGWRFASGTVFFAQTPLAVLLLERWEERCRREPRVWDQVHLDLAWEDVIAAHPLHTVWLPRAYCQIFDAPVDGEAGVVVEHFQASRECRSAVVGGPSAPRPDEALWRARRASRPV